MQRANSQVEGNGRVSGDGALVSFPLKHWLHPALGALNASERPCAAKWSVPWSSGSVCRIGLSQVKVG